MYTWKSKIGFTFLGFALMLSLVCSSAVFAEEPQDYHPQHGEAFRHGDNFHVHKQQYLLLLAEKYAPDTVEQWKAEIVKRDELKKQFRRMSETAENKNNAAKAKDHRKGAMKHGMKYGKEMHQSMNRLGEALNANNADQVKMALGEVFTNYQKCNQQLEEQLKQHSKIQ